MSEMDNDKNLVMEEPEDKVLQPFVPLAARSFHITADVLARIEHLAALGLTNPQIAASYNVSADTFRYHVNRDPELALAIERGVSLGLEKVAKSLYDNAVNKNNVVAQIFFLKNRAPSQWEEVQKRVSWNAKENPQNHMKSLDDFYTDLKQLDDPQTVEGVVVEVRESDTKS